MWTEIMGEVMFEEVMAMDFPYLKKDTNLQIRETWRILEG